MNGKEILQWAIKGITQEIAKQEKKLRRDLLLLQAHKKGIQDNINHEKVENRISDAREQIELLQRKKAFLIVQLDE